MADSKRSAKTKQSSGRTLRQARVITDTGDAMLAALKGREVELVGRGPHRCADGTFVAEIIATEAVLSDLAEALSPRRGRLEIRPRRRISARLAQVGEGNRYREEGGLPHGVGVKE